MPNPLINITRQASTRLFTFTEELTHSITHGIGAGLSIVGLILLVLRAAWFGNTIQVISFSIYGGSLILMYLASTLYHAFYHPQLKQLFKIFDHAAIYLLIAGTYTPFLLVAIEAAWRWTLLAIIWGLALLGVSFKALFIERFQRLSVLGYILMGWLSVVIFRDLAANLPVGGMIWLAAGGVAYTAGVIFYALQKIPYMHAIWHLFVMAGSLCHFFAVFFYLAPK